MLYLFKGGRLLLNYDNQVFVCSSREVYCLVQLSFRKQVSFFIYCLRARFSPLAPWINRTYKIHSRQLSGVNCLTLSNYWAHGLHSRLEIESSGQGFQWNPCWIPQERCRCRPFGWFADLTFEWQSCEKSEWKCKGDWLIVSATATIFVTEFLQNGWLRKLLSEITIQALQWHANTRVQIADHEKRFCFARPSSTLQASQVLNQQDEKVDWMSLRTLRAL